MPKPDLSDVVDLAPDGIWLHDGLSLVASGPLTKQPATLAFRVVLVRSTKEWIVYNQLWNTDEIYSANGVLSPPREEYHFDQGFYTEDFVKAVQEFCSRINKPEQLASLLR